MRYTRRRSSLTAVALVLYALVWTSSLALAQSANDTPAPGTTITAQYLYVSGAASNFSIIAAYRINSDGTLTSVGDPFPIGMPALSMVSSAWGRKLLGLGFDRLWSFAVDPPTGRLKVLQVLHFPHSGAQQDGLRLGINSSSTLLFVLKLLLGDSHPELPRITTYRIAPSGILTPIASTTVPELFVEDPIMPIAIASTGRFLYVNTGGISSPSGNITQLSIHQATGVLTTIGSLPVDYQTNLAANPTGPVLYQNTVRCSPAGCELGISVFSIDSTTGSLSNIQRVACLCAGPGVGYMAVSPKGDLLFERTAHPDGISVFSVDLATGLLTPEPNSFLPTQSKFFVTDGTGEFLFTVGPELTVSSYRIGEAGAVTPVETGVPLPSNMNKDVLTAVQVATVRQ